MNNSTKLLELAKEKFGKLSKAEENLFKAVAKGETADYSAKAKKDNDPSKAEKWGKERVLKADRIAWLCIDPQASALVTYRGIFVRGAGKGTISEERKTIVDERTWE